MNEARATYRPAVCLQCSLGCRYKVRVGNGQAEAIEYDRETPNEGALCARAYVALDLLSSTARAQAPEVRGEGGLRPATWDAAGAEAARRLSRIRERYGAGAVAVLAGPNLTNEEAAGARRLAHEIIGTPLLAGGLSGPDHALLEGLRRTPAPLMRLHELAAADVVLAVGDPLGQAPAVARAMLSSKYGKRGNALIAICGRQTGTTWFATQHLHVKPGSEALALAGVLKSAFEASGAAGIPGIDPGLAPAVKALDFADICDATGAPQGQLAQAARTFVGAQKGAIVLSPGYGQAGGSGAAVALAGALARACKGQAGVLLLTSCGNGFGVWQSLGPQARSPQEIAGRVVSGEVKALVALACDPYWAAPSADFVQALGRLELLAVAGAVPTRTARLAHVFLPAACWLEAGGSVTLWDGREQALAPVQPPLGEARPILDAIEALMKGLGTRRLDSPFIARSQPAELANELAAAAGQKQADGLLLIGLDGAAQFGEPGLREVSSWAQATLPAPYVELNPKDAARLELPERALAAVVTPHAMARLSVRYTEQVRPGVASVPAGFAETRALFGPDGARTAVSISRVAEHAAAGGGRG